MSGFFVCDQPLERFIPAAYLSFVEWANIEEFQHQALNGCVVRPDKLGLWGPALHEETGVRVILSGRPAFDEEYWLNDAHAAGTGGHAARIILRQY